MPLPPGILEGGALGAGPGELGPPMGEAPAPVPDTGPTLPDDRYLLELFQQYKDACFDQRWVWEREWLRDIYYTLGRQWIHYHPTRREWIDKRFSRKIPRPVTNKLAEIVQAVRSTFGEISIGVACRPVGNTTRAIAAAEIADQIAPLIHEEHEMGKVMREADWWQLVNGTSCLQMSWDNDKRFNRNFVQHEQCLVCGTVSSPADIMEAGQVCPVCGNQQFTQATEGDPPQPVGEWVGGGRGKTSALSPFEYAIPSDVTRFDETPYLIRVRWRDRSYYEANYPDIVHTLRFNRNPSDTSLQIYRSLSVTTDLSGVASGYLSSSTSSSQQEGITEYELWLRPTDMFPDGLVMRVAGDETPTIIHDEAEGLPGPFPYTDIEGRPLFPFAHCVFEEISGRFYGRSLIAPLIKKQDQINQLDSLIQQIAQRMANPVWIIPEGSGIDNFTGDPGLVLRWSPQAAGGLAKPERISGEPMPSGLYQLREQYMMDIEELSGAFEILKGDRPKGVEAYSALQLLVERSHARFTSAWKSRGEMYRKWFEIAIEMERQFGPDERTQTLIGHNKGHTFRHFEKAQLQGNIAVKIEDGTNVPKSALGKRATIEHLNQMGFIDPQNPDQRYTIMTELGAAQLDPGLDIHVQSALRLQNEFEEWAQNPVGPHPLVVKPWHNPLVHKAERLKWLNTDNMSELLKEIPPLEAIIIQHIMELDMVAAMQLPPGGVPETPPPPMPGQGPPLNADTAIQGTAPPQEGPYDQEGPEGGQGAGRAMRNANNNAGAPTGMPNTPGQQ